MAILIYDDNEENLKVMENTLSKVGYDVTSSTNIIESIKIIESNDTKIYLIITKFDISQFSLKDYLYIVRKLNKNIRVVVLSSSNNAKDEIESIDLCVDEYIRKPVSTAVLQKRVEMLLTDKNENILFIKRDLVTIDTINNVVKKDSKIINLSMKEYKLLVYLTRNCNSIISRRELFEQIWNCEYDEKKARTIDVHISNLKGKIELLSLFSVRGIGYKLEN